VKVGEGKGRVQFVKDKCVQDKCMNSVGSGYGESKVWLGEVNVFRELERRDCSVWRGGIALQCLPTVPRGRHKHVGLGPRTD